MTNEEAALALKNLLHHKDFIVTLYSFEQDAIEKAIAALQNQPEWVPVEMGMPKEMGTYWVTVYNREWNREKTGIVQGAEPRKTEGWEYRKNLHSQMPDGKWVTMVQRIYNPELKTWSGYGEIALAWMTMPKPFAGLKEKQKEAEDE